MAFVSNETLRRCALVTIRPRQPPGAEVSAAFNREWNESASRRFLFPLCRRPTVVFEEGGARRTGEPMAAVGPGSTPQPPDPSADPSGQQTTTIISASSFADIRSAAPSVAPGGQTTDQTRHSAA